MPGLRTATRVAAVLCTAVLAVPAAAVAQQSAVDLAVPGRAKLALIGAASGDRAGEAVAAAGDVNGDGRGDVVIGAPLADNNGRAASGSAYVVFGRPGPATVDLANLGAGGFRIDGASTTQQVGTSVAGAGDVNADGRADVIVGSFWYSQAYVIFGKSGAAGVDLASLGTRGFRVVSHYGEVLGRSVGGAGDVNRDGYADVIVGAPEADNSGESYSGSAYVVFGSAHPADVMVNQPPFDGFRIDGAEDDDRAGDSVAGQGDVNGDGRPDIIVGAPGFDTPDAIDFRRESGGAYVVFGKSSTGTVDLGELGAGGFRIDGADDGDSVGVSVAGAGDINGDASADAIVRGDEAPAYIVYGKSDTGRVDLFALARPDGFRIDNAFGWSTRASAAAAGDINGDRRPDVIVGATYANNTGRPFSGAAYVVFGRPSPDTIDVTALGAGGLRIDGAALGDYAGTSVAAAGDVDADRRPDVMVGAPQADGAGTDSGAAYVVGYDASAPRIVLRTPVQDGKYQQGTALRADYDCVEEFGGAGLASCHGTLADGALLPTAALGVRTFAVSASDRAGNTAVKSVGYMIVGADDDRDGYTKVASGGRAADCDDSNPAIHSGAFDLPGNGVDEDCSGADAVVSDKDHDGVPDHIDRCPTVPRGVFDSDGDGCVGPYRVIRAKWRAYWLAAADGLTIHYFGMTNLPRRGKLEVLCRRRGCSDEQTLRAKAHGRVALKTLENQRLRRGERFRIRITAGGFIGQLHTVTVRRYATTAEGLRKANHNPFKTKVACLPAGSRKPAARCPRRPQRGP